MNPVVCTGERKSCGRTLGAGTGALPHPKLGRPLDFDLDGCSGFCRVFCLRFLAFCLPAS